MEEENCVFCKIVKGELPCHKLAEEEVAIAFLDINPCSPGHALVIPKKHYERLEDMPREEVEKLIGLAHEVAKAIVKAVNADGFNLGINNGRAAGQEIMHVHFNIIPRFQGDGGRPIQSLVKVEVKESLEEVAKKIREAWSKPNL